MKNMKASRYMADVSSNNSTVDVANYSRAGHAAIAVKATEGEHYVNPFHLEQCNTAHDFGLTVVHYHFCRPGNIEQEIAHFRNTYNKAWRDGDYACFDIEDSRLGTHYANTILDDYCKKTSRQPVLYTGLDFFQNNLRGVQIPGGRKWIAKYGSPPVGFSVWAWQYSDGKDGPEPHFYTGIGNCDGSILSAGVAKALYTRKLKTRRRK